MTKIELAGDLSISNAEELHKIFKSAVQKNADIELDVSKLEDIDTSIIQLVIALFNALGDQHELHITGKICERVKQRLYICGVLSSTDFDDTTFVQKVKERLEASK